MTLSLALACLWAFVANVGALFPSKRHHWPLAYVLISVGVPLLAFVYYENGIWWTLGVFLAAASILRWPVRFAIRWLRRTFLRQNSEPI